MKTVLCISFGICTLFGCSGKRPSQLGVNEGSLAPCPESPNCVSSQAAGEHYIEPIKYQASRQHAYDAMMGVLRHMKRVKIITSDENYIHAECRSRIFRFVDDLELYFPENEQIIHVRSASRVGYSDMGVNRKRVEGIRGFFSRTHPPE